MNRLKPVPGVWYENADDENDQRYLYAPHPSGMYPWWGGNNKWLRADEVPSNLKVWFNPHPPTRTEWLVLDGDEQWSAFDDYETARQQVDSYDGSFSEDHIRLGKRQVTETEWKEVTDV